MKIKSKIMDEIAVTRAMARITHEIIEKNNGAEDIILLGVKRRGVPLSLMLAENIKKFEQVEVPVGYLDITRHRDDLTEADKQSLAGECHFPCDITDKTVIIVDDVLYTGRTARAAIESVFAFGRPKALQLAVLVDRGHRELPIRADYVCKNLPTSHTEKVLVKLPEFDSETGVFIAEKNIEN